MISAGAYPAGSGWTEAQKGLAYGLVCYVFWGLFPLYWYPLLGQPIGADQLLAQRIVWSSLLAVLLLLLGGQWRQLYAACRQPRVLGIFGLSALALSINWLTYLWAVTHQQVLGASLGYFMSPLVSIALGRLMLGEHLSRLQWWAVALAAAGVLWLAVLAGRVPWVALGLSVSFGFYGLLRKRAPLAALPGLALETLMMLPLALAYLAWCRYQGVLVFGELPWLPQWLIIGSGVVTTLPLLLFAASARRISLTNLGMIQYVSPSIQLMLGLWVFNEAFHPSRFAGYLWVWAGVLLFVWGSVRAAQSDRRRAAAVVWTKE